MNDDDREWNEFRQSLESAIGMPLHQYKEAQMRRRLGALRSRERMITWEEFASALERRPELLDMVKDTLTINVSEFFRQPERFTELQKTYIPEMLQHRPALRIWSAGCSIGCEPYTLAIILKELSPEARHSILATDVDMPILAKAQSGAGYLPEHVRSVPEDILRKYFTFDGSTYAVSNEVKRMVQFRRHDLLSDAYPRDLDLILCRNVVIYFNEDAKAYIYDGFARALRSGGLLFIGGSEMIMRSQDLGLRSAAMSMYRKAA
jgi:chemotaxis protein methyltransferase CheR